MLAIIIDEQNKKMKFTDHKIIIVCRYNKKETINLARISRYYRYQLKYIASNKSAGL
jgi:hypothetical protein